jgi:hypothetical protein
MAWVTVGVTVASAIGGKMSADKDKRGIARNESAAATTEQQRQQSIDANRGLVNKAFDSPQRQAQYDDYAAAMREYTGGELVRQKRDAARNLKFALAKGGQIGGSQQVAGERRLGEEYARGALDNERQVQTGVAQLKGADDASRNNLLQLVERGMGATDSLRRSSQQLTSNIGNASLTSMQKGLGDVFGDTFAAYKAINDRAAQRAGFGYKTNRKELYG